MLSRGRDEYFDHRSWTQSTGGTWSGIVAVMDQTNGRWVQATRDLSSRLLTELLGYTGELVSQYFSELDSEDLGDIVSWAGPDPAPHWLNIAREYTE